MKSIDINIETEEGKVSKSLGIEQEGSIQIALSVSFKNGEIVSSEIHINGYDATNKHNWFSKIFKGKFKIQSKSSENSDLSLPLKTTDKKQIQMPQEEKLRLYEKLKQEFEK